MINKIFDSNNSSVWLILSILSLVVGTFFSLMTPLFISLVRFQTDTKIGFSPTQAATLYQVLAFIALAIGLYFIYKLSKKSMRIVGGLLGVGLFSLISFMAFNQYIYVDKDYIEAGNGFGGNQYSWSEIKELYYDKNDDGVEWFELITSDGNKIEVVFGGLLNTGAKNHIRRSIESNGVKMIDIS